MNQQDDDVACNRAQLSEIISFTKMKQQADLQLLSLLEKIANPLTEVDLKLTLKGIYAPAEQWKQTDEANPNIFTYSTSILGNQFSSGKIEPRKLTEKQLKEQQEAKNKKGAKKDAKEEEKPQQVDPEQEQRRKQWEALPEQEKFHRTQEDPYKAFSLLFPQNVKEQKLSHQTLKSFEDDVSSGQVQIVLTRKPEGGEEDIAKIKKSKPKGLNLGELYTAEYKGTLNLEGLTHPGATSIIQRVPLQFGGELPPDFVRIDLDKCYALIEIELSQAINPLVTEEKPTARDLLGQQVSKPEANLLIRLSEQIRKGMRSISQEYSAFFAKEKDHASEDRRMNTSSNNTNLLTVSTLRITEISKRKQQFLNQFAASGKYNILRQRLGKTVRAIVIDKCRKEKNGSSVSKQHLQKILSELNVYLRQMIEKTLDEAVNNEAHGLHEDLVLGHEYHRAARKQALASVSQSPEDRQARLAQQYEIINKIPEAQQKFINLVVLKNHSLASLQSYARFCLRHSYYDKAYATYNQINSQSNDFKHRIVISFFQAQRGREQEAIAGLLRLSEGQASTQDNALVHNLLSFLYERLEEQKKSEKHLALAEKYYQMKTNPHLKINPPKNPYLEPTPKVPKPGKYISQLTQSEDQQMRLYLMNYFIDYGFFKLAKDYINKLQESTTKSIMLAQILLSEEKYDDAINVVEKLLDKDPKNMELLTLKADICFLSQKLFECEEVFLYLLKLKPSATYSYTIYMRLALTYLHRKSWQDAKTTFNKAVELRPNSAAGWLGLGIANLRLGALKESQEALSLSKIYNPVSNQSTEYLRQIEVQINREHRTNYQYLTATVS